MTPPPDLELIALARHHLRHARAPVPVRGKCPWDVTTGSKLIGWQNLTVTEENVEALFRRGAGLTGVGVRLGRASGALVDVDLDTPEAIVAADVFLPPSACVFGRATARRSHRVYRALGIATARYQDPGRATLVELRSDGSQTVWPGSMRLADDAVPQDEWITYDLEGEPADVDPGTLAAALRYVAACTLLARHWPRQRGNRHDIALAASGFLLRAGLDERTTVVIIETAARIAGDEEWRERGRDARSTADRQACGTWTTGGRTLAALLGEAVVRRLTEWLSVHRTDTADSANGSDSWAEPIPLDTLAVPAFPVDALPTTLREMVCDVAAVTRVPTDLPALAGLGALAVATARSAHVVVGGSHHEPLNLYVAPAAESGERKGPALRAMLGPLYEVQDERQRAARPEVAAAAERRRCAEKRLETLRAQAAKADNPADRERLTAEAEAVARELPPVLTLPKLLVSDRTPEKLECDLAEQGGTLAIASEEAGTLFEAAGGRYSRDGGAQLDTFLKAYDGGEIDTDRVTRGPVAVKAPALSIIVTPQPFLLSQLRKRPDFHHRGLLPRILFAMPTSLVGEREYDPMATPDEVIRAAYNATLRLLLALPKPADVAHIPPLHIDGDALAAWGAYHDRVEREMREGGRLRPIREWANKQPGRVARIAGSLHLLETVGRGRPWVDRIEVGSVAAACRIGDYLEAHALAAYDVMDAHPVLEGARQVVGWLRRIQCRAFTARDAFSKLNRRRFPRMDDLTPCLTLLVEHEIIRKRPIVTHGGQLGRTPSPSFDVNPRLLEDAPHNPRDPDIGQTCTDCADSAEQKRGGDPRGDTWGEL